MMLQLTDDMRRAIAATGGGPVVVADAQDGVEYVLMRRDELELGGADSPPQFSDSLLKSLVEEGIASGPGIDADTVFERMRKKAAELASKP